jgi:5-methylcytosine-specific restriction protein A
VSTAALRTCAHPRCNRPVVRGRCDVHKLREQDRPNADVRTWYRTPEWVALRALVLNREPWCVDCLAAAGLTQFTRSDDLRRAGVRRSTDADHQVPHRGDPALFWNPENLTGRCHPHHASKTRRGE